MKININNIEKFESRHLGPDDQQIEEMLKEIGASSLDELIKQTIPQDILLKKPLDLPKGKSEFEFLNNLKRLASKNKVYKSYIGMGYYNTITPPVILRNILENPGWYTAYTPYQAEIAQGRLEALLNFQTMVMDLTGMEIANASLLDEGTAAAEAMFLLYNVRKANKKSADVFLVSNLCFPQTLDVLKTRAKPLGIKLEIGDHKNFDLTRNDVFGLFLQYPAQDGAVIDYSALISKAHENEVAAGVAADLLSLTLLTPPGEMGADVVVGTTQRLGVPMGFGGPHAAYFATKDEFKRQLPGRIIGASIDAQGKKAYRMALQTREQHIRREKATSNICTAQVLLAVISGSYAVYHGPKGLRAIGERIHGLTKVLHSGLEKIGLTVSNKTYFDTLKVEVSESEKQSILKSSDELAINFRYFSDGSIGISIDETTSLEAIKTILNVFAQAKIVSAPDVSQYVNNLILELPDSLVRKSSYLTHEVFNMHHSESEMLRYLKLLENKDLSLAHSMIPLGSCTMKLNATTEMIPVTWPEFGNLHPFAPLYQTEGYQLLTKELEKWLCEITGFAAMSLQPNSGAQGEYAGLMVIRAFHENSGEAHRDIALIPSSAHGTNPASASLAGMKIVIVKCDEKGNIDVEDLRAKAEQNKSNLSCLMITYPSTHGVFEEGIREICSIIHKNGGKVYMDGANMNAQVGLTSPGSIGADVCHLNLHKTFCIPHGGGGPGMGPIGVTTELAQFLPGHAVVDLGHTKAIHAVSAAQYGSASILPISYAYIAMMGGEGLKKATELAILNANYIMKRLEKHYPILYAGKNGRCAHEMIVDCRGFKSAGIEVEDIAKRLMDYGFHAPTVSFPVAGTLMIEPTESEPKEELDRFCDAMIEIRKEIQEVIDGTASKQDNVLKNAPHTAEVVMADEWERAYSRQKAAFPLEWVKARKFWPSVSRIDSAYGDRHLVCSCLPTDAYAEAVV